MTKAFEFVGFNFISKTLNGDLHRLSKLCFDLEEDFVWTGVFPH